jgi:hypothetical protein
MMPGHRQLAPAFSQEDENMHKSMVVLFMTCLAAPALAGRTDFKSRLIVKSDNAGPTCATSTVDGELCVAGDIETNANLDVAGTATLTGATTLTAAATASTSLTTPILASGLAVIRFCGNLPGSGTAATSYMSPVAFFGTANYEYGGSGCDGEDSATETTADEIYSGVTFRPVALRCAGICTGSSAANDAITFALQDDTASVSGMSCSFTFAGDATAAECTSTARSASATAVAGGSAIAIKMTSTNDDCDDASDDAECFLTVAY